MQASPKIGRVRIWLLVPTHAPGPVIPIQAARIHASYFTGTGLSRLIGLAGAYPGERGKSPYPEMSSSIALGCNAGQPACQFQCRLGLSFTTLVFMNQDLSLHKAVSRC